MSTVPRDYDADPDRFTAATASGDVHETIGPRLVAMGATAVLDLGCGRGRLLDALPIERWIGLDGSATQLAACPGDGRKVLGDGGSLPFADGSFDAVAALYCLYHFDEPTVVVAEAHRVLRPGGHFVACAPSRHDAPELVRHHDRSPFDAEEAEAIVEGIFGIAQGDWWDGPYVRLDDADALATYVRGHLLRADQLHDVTAPLTLTKRGVVVWAEKR